MSHNSHPHRQTKWPNYQQRVHNKSLNSLNSLSQQLALLQQQFSRRQVNVNLNSLQLHLMHNPVFLCQLVNINLLGRVDLNSILVNLNSLLPGNRLTPYLCFYVPSVEQPALNSFGNNLNMDYNRYFNCVFEWLLFRRQRSSLFGQSFDLFCLRGYFVFRELKSLQCLLLFNGFSL